MKKILVSLLLLISVTAFCQLPKIATKVKNLGAITAGVIQPINAAYADTLKSADTVFYKLVVNHSRVVFPYVSLNVKATAGADTSVITVTFWQSVDGTRWSQVLNTASPTPWATTISKANQKAGNVDIDFWRSIGWFQSQYLGIRLIATSVSGYKGIYFGSVRVNEY